MNNNDEHEMKVLKRNGDHEDVSFDKILKRMKTMGKKANININYTMLAMKVIDQLFDGITTKAIDELTAQQCASLVTKHPDYGTLAGLIVVSNHQKNTSSKFFSVVEKLWNFKDIHGKHAPIVSEALWKTVQQYRDDIENMIDYERDFLIDFFGFKTLERAYLLRVNKVILERPQHMWMRVALGIHGNNMEKVKETYDLMSQKYFTHATPTLFNAGTPRPQLSSCYLIAMEDDSIDGIYNTLKECALISKWAGGIGLHVHNIRASGSHIRGTNGTSNGLVPMLRVFNNTARYVDQGGGRRNGSIAIYLEPWHSDIDDFLELKKNHGDEELRARDLFYALWICSLFMKRVEKDGDWSLFCPDECPMLAETYGEEFEALYEQYEKDGRAKKVIKARDLWFKILDSQMETGTPYLVFKDAANQKSNQKNLGTIKSSNLCSEIIEYSNKDETAVCNLASIGLSKYVKEDKTFDYEKLHQVTKVVARNLNKVIDVNYYPTEKTRRSNMLHRPIGIGVQGLADTFILMDIAYHSEKAVKVNKLIFETIYHAALESSYESSKERFEKIMIGLFGETSDQDVEKFNKLKDELAFTNEEMASNAVNNPGRGVESHKKVDKKYYPAKMHDMLDKMTSSVCLNEAELNQLSGLCMGAYSSFVGSPASQGILQFDMWNVTPSDRYNWKDLKEKIKKYGLRNSLLIAPMPTASTSQILGNNECFEPITSNIYTRRTLAGEFVVANKYLMRELIELGMWNEKVKNNIIANKGSIKYIEGIPEHIKEKYKIVWEMPMKHLINMSRDRGAFVCQSQSLNLWMENPNYKSLTAMHFYSWKAGLKTGIYYLRRKARHQAQQFTIEPEKQRKMSATQESDEEEECLMCGS